jgi:hypothetical protein
MRRLLDWGFRGLLAGVIFGAFAVSAHAQTITNTPPIHPVVPAVHSKKIKATDCDNHPILVNRPGILTVVIGTSEDSQDAARQAGKVMYPLQGRPDFQLVVVVDLRNSIATWAPSIVLSRMRASLDDEAIDLKPYFLKNGNKGNPRNSLYVIPDFSGTICPQLNWPDGSDDLRGVLFGTDGREITRWDKIDDMAKLQTDVRAAVQVLIDADKEKAAAASKSQGTKLIQPSTAHPPMLPPMTFPLKD